MYLFVALFLFCSAGVAALRYCACVRRIMMGNMKTFWRIHSIAYSLVLLCDNNNELAHQAFIRNHCGQVDSSHLLWDGSNKFPKCRFSEICNSDP